MIYFKHTLATAIIFLFCLNSNSQTALSGFIKTAEDTSIAVQGATITAINPADTTKTQTTISGENGAYSFEETNVAIDKSYLEDDLIQVESPGHNDFTFTITSKHVPVNKGEFFDLTGKKLGNINFERVTNGVYTGFIDLPPMGEQHIIFRDDAGHPGKKLFVAQEGQAMNVQADFKTKSSSMDDEEIINFKVDDGAEDLYQPLDTTITLQKNQENTQDFALKEWQKYSANINFNLEDKFGNKIPDVTINADQVNADQGFTTETDPNGNGAVEGIEIPNNKPGIGNIDLAIEIQGNDYINTIRDTLRDVTAGNIVKNYHNLTPKQQEFLATIGVNITEDGNENPLENFNLKLYEEGSTDTIRMNENGEVNNINIPALNEITPDSLDLEYILEKAGWKTKTGSKRIGQGNNTLNESMEEDGPVEMGEATIWRAIQENFVGLEAEAILYSNETGFRDTFEIQNAFAWKQKVPAIKGQLTEYTLEINSTVPEDKIPFNPFKKIIKVEDGKTYQGIDDLIPLEQTFRILSNIKYMDTYENATNVDFVIRDLEGNVVDSIRTPNDPAIYDQIRSIKLPVGFEGFLNIHLKEEGKDEYKGHINIPIVKESRLNTVPSELGPLGTKDKLTSIPDTTIRYDVDLLKRTWINPKTKQVENVNPAHIYQFAGGMPINLQWVQTGIQNIYLSNREHEATEEYQNYIKDNFNLPYDINFLSERLTKLLNVTSLEQENFDEFGFNMHMSPQGGITYIRGSGEFRGMSVYNFADIEIPQEDMIGIMREVITRGMGTSEIPDEFYTNPGNLTSPKTMTDQEWNTYCKEINYLYTFFRNMVGGEHLLHPEKTVEGRIPHNRIQSSLENNLIYTGITPSSEYSKQKYKDDKN